MKKAPAVETQKEVTQRLAVYSPKDKQFKAIEISLDELRTSINKYVEVKDGHNSEAGPVFFVERPEDINATFDKLRKDSLMTEKNLKIIIRNEQINPGIKEIVLRFFYWEPELAKERYKLKNIVWNIGLFIATIVTVSIAGWQYAKNIYESYFFQGRPVLDVFLFTFSLIAILGTHELGHYAISRMKKLDASLPYFIPVPPLPGIQTLGTFGALIRQKEPFATRDDLFDIGIAGPIAGFLVTIPVFLIGLKMTYIVDINPDLLVYDPADIPTVFLMDFMILIGQWLRIVPYFDPTMQTVTMHPMMFAGYIGLLITGLNLMPASQLDGGHTARAVFGGMTHRIVSLVISLLLVVNPFTRIFGFLVLIMSFMQHPGAIDDVSKVHWSKYIYISIGYIIGFLCLPLPIELLKQLL
ncbi:MAG: site-2 protease family protein [Candidatus Heimdallarchaeota archaeon]|nr:site-2 protease family protein [Candidatus Heimdallarchaeota archaeon]